MDELKEPTKTTQKILMEAGINPASAKVIHQNINIVIKADYGLIPVCVKLYKPTRSNSRRVTSVLQEANTLISLYQDGICVPQIICINQSPVIGAENISGYIYMFVETSPVNSYQTQELYLLALNLAKLHNHQPYRHNLGPFSILYEAISGSLEAGNRYFPLEKILADQWALELLNIWEAEILTGLSELQNITPVDFVLSTVHGRMKPEHVFCVQDNNLLILDWETICVSERVMELAYVLSRLCLMDETQLLDEYVLKAVLDEYLKSVVFNKVERTALKSIFRWECFWALFVNYHKHRLFADICIRRDSFIQRTQMLGNYEYDLFD